MNVTDRKEASAILRRQIKELGTTVTDSKTDAAANLRRSVGALDAGADLAIERGPLGAPVREAFGFARDAGATFDALERLRLGAVEENPVGLAAIVVASLFVRLALVTMAEVVAKLDLDSRDEVERLQAVFDAGFYAAEEDAANDFDSDAYPALVALHASVTRDLTYRSRPLARMVTYRFSERMPALLIAQKLFQDGGRFEEIIAENRHGNPHPLFLSEVGRALSR